MLHPHRLLVASLSIIAIALVLAGASASESRAALTGAWTAEGNQAGANFGYAVATAGDVNGDGKSDLLIGAPFFDGAQVDLGRVSIYHGGPSGLSTVTFTLDGLGNASWFGAALSSAGDVNADGYDDIIIGASHYSNLQPNGGAIYVHLGSPAGIGAVFQLGYALGNAQSLFGGSVAGAGDVNGDGHDDVLIGAEGFDAPVTDAGRGFLFYGSANGVTIQGNWAYNGTSANARLGTSVSPAGDVNGDGYADIAFGVPGAGRIVVFHGGASGPPATPNFTGQGIVSHQHGRAVSTAGDVNGDGFADVIVGAPYATNVQSEEGRAFLYLGSANGLTSPPAWQMESNVSGAHFGWSVAAAGDVNGDGYADVLVGAKDLTDGQSQEGRCYLFYGSATGLLTTPTWIADGSLVNAQLGFACATAGDVNGDGHSDVVAAGPYTSNPQPQEGRVAVWHGSADVPAQGVTWFAESNQSGAQLGRALALGDFNGDGYSDAVVGTGLYDNVGADGGRVLLYSGAPANLAGGASWTAVGVAAGDRFGDAVASAGDVNGDGYDDLLVGAPRNQNRGAAYLYMGAPGGLGGAPTWTTLGEQVGDLYGFALGTAGDLNGDGFSDVVVGAPFHAASYLDEGKVYVYLGSAAGLATQPAWTRTGGQASALFGHAAGTAGDVNGDGFSDLAVGAPQYTAGESREGVAFVFRGDPNGIDPAPPWIGQINQANASFGQALATAGDVNGDGYSDIVIGAPAYDDAATDQGAAFVYRGSAAGLETTPLATLTVASVGARCGTAVAAGDLNADGLSDVLVGMPYIDNPQVDEGWVVAYAGPLASPVAIWGADGNSNNAWHGTAIASGGDVTGDGFTDVLTGAPGTSNPTVQEGIAYLWVGNGRFTTDNGLDRRPRMRQPDDANPIALLGHSESPNEFRLDAQGRTALGRGRVRLEVEVKPFGVRFDGDDLVVGPWLNTGPPVMFVGCRVGLPLLVGGLAADRGHHWRLRIRSEHHLAPATPWFSPSGNAWEEMDLSTAPATAVAEGGAPATSFALVARPSIFAHRTTLAYAVATAGPVRLAVYDVLGRCASVLVDEVRPAGRHEVAWDGRGSGGERLPSGIYFARLGPGGAGSGSVRLVLAR